MSNALIMTGRSLRLSARSPEALLTALLLPVMLMVVFVYLFGGAVSIGTAYVAGSPSTSRPRRSPRPSAACSSATPARCRWPARWPGAAASWSSRWCCPPSCSVAAPRPRFTTMTELAGALTSRLEALWGPAVEVAEVRPMPGGASRESWDVRVRLAGDGLAGQAERHLI